MNNRREIKSSGPIEATASDTIIPYASGPVLMTLDVEETAIPGIPYFIGFGNASPGISIFGQPIDLATGAVPNLSFPLSHSSVISALVSKNRSYVN